MCCIHGTKTYTLAILYVTTPFEKCAIPMVCTILSKGNHVNIPEPEYRYGVFGTKAATQMNLEMPTKVRAKFSFLLNMLSTHPWFISNVPS